MFKNIYGTRLPRLYLSKIVILSLNKKCVPVAISPEIVILSNIFLSTPILYCIDAIDEL